MHDKDTAHGMPVSDKSDLLHGVTAHSVSVSVQTPDRSPEEQHPPQRILVVEDDPTLAALEAEVLTASGYTVITVPSGELAIAAFRHCIPDLVVLDLELIGEVHGWDVLHHLRASSSIPVLLTTSSIAAVRKQMRSRDEDRLTLDHLPKPYPIHVFLKRIQRMLMIAPQ